MCKILVLVPWGETLQNYCSIVASRYSNTQLECVYLEQLNEYSSNVLQSYSAIIVPEYADITVSSKASLTFGCTALKMLSQKGYLGVVALSPIDYHKNGLLPSICHDDIGWIDESKIFYLPEAFFAYLHNLVNFIDSITNQNKAS